MAIVVSYLDSYGSSPILIKGTPLLLRFPQWEHVGQRSIGTSSGTPLENAPRAVTSSFTGASKRGDRRKPHVLDQASPTQEPDRSGATVLLEDRVDNPGTIVGHCVDGLAAMLWQAELHDLDASRIRWFRLTGEDLAEVRFGLAPENRGGFFGIPQWSPFSDDEGEGDHQSDGVRAFARSGLSHRWRCRHRGRCLVRRSRLYHEPAPHPTWMQKVPAFDGRHCLL
jgi:hypothetical protein